MLSSTFLIAVLSVFILGGYILDNRRKSRHLPLPPGPPRLPIVGNLHQAPKSYPWRTYREWAKIYGPIFSLQYGKDTIIILSSHQTAKDLLDKRSGLYSSRPHFVMADDCVSKGNRSLLLPYGPQYRLHQRVQGGLLQPRFAKHYVKLQDLESKQLMFELLSASDTEWRERFHRCTSSLIFSLAYGKRMARGDEDEIKDVEKVAERFERCAQVGAWIVDAIPILNRLPKFLAPWKRVGDETHEFESAFYMRIMEEARNSKSWNWIKEAESMKETRQMPRKEVAYLVGILYEAGSDTTNMAMASFVMAALTYPDEIKKIQRELDLIIKDRFPTFEDRHQLACVEAVAKEVLRWRPVSAGGIPHAIDQKDNEYMGYRIPKGSTVLANHWAIDLDEEVYGEDALEFRPSRWLETPDLPLASFGYGRRVCTGQHIAMNSLFINIARILWAFDIEHAMDESGKQIEVNPLAYSGGFNSGPLPFPARFVVRNEARRLVIEKEWASVGKDIRVHLDEIERATSKGP